MYSRIERLIFKNMQYIVRYPDKYKVGEQYPVILFLHGAGTRGNNIEVLLNNPYFRITDTIDEFPFITFAPLCSANTWFDIFGELIEFVCMFTGKDYVDSKRVYLMGASMGGYAAWQMGMSIPECFAAIVPICGGGMYWNAGRLVDVPIWAFHGKKDTTVLVEESLKMVDAVNQCGGNAKFTVYPDDGHDAWSDTYANQEIYSWMLEHKKGKVYKPADFYTDSNIYG